MLGSSPNRPARESIQLRASRARERDKRDDGVARHASELSVRSTHRSEGLAATNRGQERGAGPYPKPPCPRKQPTRAREHDDGVSRCGALVLRRTERTMRPKYLSSRGPRRDE